MLKKIVLSLLPGILVSVSLLSYAAPWFTGPLFAPAGKTIPLGHANFEMYGFFTKNTGVFDRSALIVDTPALKSNQANPIFSYGLTDRIDAQLSVPYTKNYSQGRTGRHIGDNSVILGYQLITEKPDTFIPSLRVTIQEIFPIGRFDGLNPTDKGTGATGLGSYQSVLSFNFQKLAPLGKEFYLRGRLSLAYLYANRFDIDGASSSGGGIDARGSINPGNVMTADIAAELSVTQNWVAVMEGYYIHRQAASFRGHPGFDDAGNLIEISRPDVSEYSIAPAIEYNFNANYGIILGTWFAVKGKNAPNFRSTVVALNAFW